MDELGVIIESKNAYVRLVEQLRTLSSPACLLLSHPSIAMAAPEVMASAVPEVPTFKLVLGAPLLFTSRCQY